MLEGYRIRRFSPDDLEQVEMLNRVFLPENYPGFFFLENYRRFPEAFLVAESGEGKVVGYVMCRVESYYASTETVILGHVLSIAVDKRHRRKGIGRRLMMEAERGLESYGCDAVYLEVRISNEPAIRLYEGLGYKILGVIPRYYADGEDAYLMYKMLAPDAREDEVTSVLKGRVRT